MSDVLQFPVQGKPCRTCGFVMDRDAKNDECFCCLHQVPLPLAVPAKSGEPCRECAGTGHVSVHICEDDRECARKCPEQQQCIACGASGLTP